MTRADIGRLRLISQIIIGSKYKTPGEVVAHMLAMQAQDFAGALWSVGLRLPGSSEKDILHAISARQIIRTWPMRGTLHFVAADDVYWMLELLTARVLGGTASRQNSLGIDGGILARSRKVFFQGLEGGRCLTRPQMYTLLEKNGVSTSGQRGYHILWQAAQAGLICFGPLVHNEQTFVLLREWVPDGQKMTRTQALTELAIRYFRSHGPATLGDLVRWSGLMVRDAKVGIDGAAAALHQEEVDGQVYFMDRGLPSAVGISPSVCLLPGFDEYVLGYQDRGAVLDPGHAQKICPGNNGMFSATIVDDGQIVGTWKRKLASGGLEIVTNYFAAETPQQVKEKLDLAADKYAKFLGHELIQRTL